MPVTTKNQTAVRSASIYYLRSLLELVTGHALDFEIELVYNMIKHSITAVSLEPDQVCVRVVVYSILSLSGRYTMITNS